MMPGSVAVGVFSDDRMESSHPKILFEPAARDMGIEATRISGVPESPVDCVHLTGSGQESAELAVSLQKSSIPFVFSPPLFPLSSPSAKRVFRSLGWNKPGEFRRRSEISSLASAIVTLTPSQLAFVETVFRIDRRRIVCIPPAFDEEFLHADGRVFVQKYGVDRFVLAIPSTAEDVSRLAKALERIYHPGVFLLSHDISVNFPDNPRLSLIKSADPESYRSAFAACSVYVDASSAFSIESLNAAAAGARIVVSRRGEEFFGPDADYVEPTSWELIHHGITTALNRPGEALRERVRAENAPLRVVSMLRDLYRSLLTERNS